MKNLTDIVTLVRNTKFIVMNILVIIVLIFVFISGDAKETVLNFYATVTGQQYALYVKVNNKTHPTYLILKDKLQRENKRDIEALEVRVHQVNNKHYNYKYEINGNERDVSMSQQENGTWQVR